MTVEQQVDALATSVDELKGAVVTKKATLDSSVVDAQSATTQAQAAKTNALSARDQSGSFKDAAYTAAQSAASAVAYQDLTALAAEKVVTAVDVFIYDTTKDSDGGAWRNRCAGTSWFNEPLNTATRGGRREFPAVAVIVAEAAKMTIYDADDPTLPMWRVHDLTGFTVNAICASGGKILIATDGGLIAFDYLADSIDGSVSYSASTSPAIVNNACIDVAMTVLPDAPIDQATGLPVPYIPVATDGGLSVITDSGDVYDSDKTTAVEAVSVDAQGMIRVTVSDGDLVIYDPADVTADGFTGTTLDATTTPALLGAPTSLAVKALGSTSGLSLLAGGDGMVAYTTPTYTTGWMPGHIKGAFLSDTDDTDLVGSGELVTNGTFGTDLTGWVDFSQAGGSIAWNPSGAMDITNATANGDVYQAIAVTVGHRYRVSFDNVGSANVQFFVGTSIGGAQLVGVTITNGGAKGDREFVATAATVYLTFSERTAGDTSTIDNVSVKLADADRSVNNKGLIVNGTVTREPVATGAELIAYSGFSEANYLEGTGASYVDTLYALGWEQTNGVWSFKHGVVSDAPIDGLTITGTTLKIAGTKPKALVRVTATVPTADQLAKIEADERVLFQEIAACTLYGASDAVTALAHDPDTDLLHVGTSAGRSVFKGLRRVANTTVPVGAAIAAAGGMVVEE